jgi:hypothetical protein
MDEEKRNLLKARLYQYRFSIVLAIAMGYFRPLSRWRFRNGALFLHLSLYRHHCGVSQYLCNIKAIQNSESVK